MSWFREQLSALGEIVAPRNESALDEFKAHWLEIKKYFLDQESGGGNVENFHTSALPERFMRIVHMLRDEEREQGSNFSGPCMEYFLAEHIFDHLCALGIKDTPVGMRKLTMTMVCEFLSDIKQPVLQHNSIHKGVVNLLIACQKCADTEAGTLVDLIGAAVRCLHEAPHLVGFFFKQDQHVFASQYPVFVPFHLLQAHVTAPGNVGERARDSLLACLRFADEAVLDYVMNRSNFVSSLTTNTTSAFKETMSAAAANDASALERARQHLYGLMRTCDVVANARHACSAPLVRQFEDQVLIVSVGPSLLQVDERGAAFATRQMTRIVQLCDESGALLDSMLQFVLGDDDDNLMRDTLLRRLNECDSESALGFATLEFFEALVALHRPSVTDELVARFVAPGLHLEAGHSNASTASQFQFEHVHEAITQLLQLFPGNRYGSDTLYSEYLVDAQQYVDMQRERALANNVVGGAAGAAASTPKSALSPVKATLSLRRSQQASESASSASKLDSNGTFTEGPLLRCVLNGLEHIFEQPLAYNLILTSIVAKLAHYRNAALRAYLLDPLLPLRPGVRSVFGTLKALAKRAEARFTEAPHLLGQVALLRQDMPLDHSEARGDDKRFLYGVIVLTESCKELAAIAQAGFCRPELK